VAEKSDRVDTRVDTRVDRKGGQIHYERVDKSLFFEVQKYIEMQVNMVDYGRYSREIGIGMQIVICIKHSKYAL
jgi:alpha-glucuronidase